jgi:hypothetical protein
MSPDRPRRRDLRAYARSTQARLIAGALLLVFLVGDGLVWAAYGRQAAAFAVLCTALGVAPVLAIWAGLLIVEWVVKRADRG